MFADMRYGLHGPTLPPSPVPCLDGLLIRILSRRFTGSHVNDRPVVIIGPSGRWGASTSGRLVPGAAAGQGVEQQRNDADDERAPKGRAKAFDMKLFDNPAYQQQKGRVDQKAKESQAQNHQRQ